MKFILSFLVLLLPPVLQAGSFVLIGKLSASNVKAVTLTYDANALDFIEHKSQRLEAVLKPDHSFHLEIQTNEAIQINVQIGSLWLLLNSVVFPGDTIHIEQKGHRYLITGNHQNELSFQEAFNKKFRLSILAGIRHTRAIRKLDGIAFAKFTKKEIAKEIAFIHNYNKNKPMRQEFIRRQEINSNYENGAELYRYCGGKHKHFLSDTVYTNFIKELNINNEAALAQNSYLHFVRECLFFTWNSKIDRSNLREPQTAYFLKNQYPIRDSIARRNFSGKVLDLAYFTNDIEQISWLNFYKGRAIYDSIYVQTSNAITNGKSKYSDTSYYTRVLSQLERHKQQAKPAADFTVKDLQGNPHKLSDYRGKVIYLDFWSTTCAPCVAEIPALNALIEKFKGQDVVFLSVAFDSDLEKLNRFLVKKPINGIVMVEEKGFGSKVAGDYQIQSIPRYCIIDKAGNFVNDHAPRPTLKPEEIIDSALRSR